MHNHTTAVGSGVSPTPSRFTTHSPANHQQTEVCR